MAAQHNVQFGGTMTSAQVSSPAHVLINNSSTLPNERMLHRISITPSQAQMQGYLVPPNLLSTQAPIVFAGRLMPQPELQEKRRPLNSWMAFRSFYTKIFKDHQQKETSAYLTVLWQRDPFKAKWAIVAKAYSSIRDMVGTPNAPLAGFLTIVVPEIGLLAAEVYLAQLNWDITLRDDGAMVLRQLSEPNFDILPDNIVHTSMTERDVIQLCGNRGYVSQAVAWTLLRGAPTSRRPRLQAAQQGLLATAMPPVAPVAPQQTLSSPLPPTNQFVQSVMTNPTAAATQVLGFDVDQLLGYEWTSNVGDIFNADEGHINLDAMVDNDIEANEGFTKLLDLSDPASFDRALVENNAVDGYMPLNVNDSQYY